MGNMGTDIQGIVHRITYHNEDNGFAVLQVESPDHEDIVTVIGKVLSVGEGENLRAEGDWVMDPNHGKQLKARAIHLTPPSSTHGITKYLSAGLIDGIGPEYAKRIVAAFGDTVFDVLDNTPERLGTVPGIGKKRLEQIIKSWQGQRHMKQAMMFLQEHGIGPQRAAGIYKQYGAETVDKISANPYRLYTEIKGIGFKIADKVAQSIGLARNSLVRARAGLLYVLESNSRSGHCAAVFDELVSQCEEVLGISTDIIEGAIDAEIAFGNVFQDMVGDQAWIYQRKLFYGELGIAQLIRRLQQGTSPIPDIDAQKAIWWVQQKNELTLAQSQQTAITQALTSKVFVITGGPGVGKTTLVNSIVKILTAKDLRIALTAPTGRAAKRMQEATGQEAKTLHRLLEYEPINANFKRDVDNPLEFDVIIVDETSMVDVILMYFLLRAIDPHAVLILVGDVDQLPSVGPGKVLEDIINSQAIPTVKLTEIHRQAAESQIVTNAHRINHGQMPILDNPEGTDFYFIESETPVDITQTLIRAITERIPKRFNFNPTREVQVLSPMHHSPIGTEALNRALQEALNPDGEVTFQLGENTYREGDKVMQIENNYDKEVFNGDIGFISRIDHAHSICWVDIDHRLVEYAFTDMYQLTLAYACTIHKSQGSEYPCVVIPVHTQHAIMWQRKLLYTAVTRSKNLVVLIGTTQALDMAVKDLRKTDRQTALRQRLNGELPDPPPDMLKQGFWHGAEEF